eukprot:2674606-Prymnesium_polylepis.1
MRGLIGSRRVPYNLILREPNKSSPVAVYTSVVLFPSHVHVALDLPVHAAVLVFRGACAKVSARYTH